ncbi:MAG: hypothetical protein ABJO09_19790 [Hyphomicrobiales bacterium]
MTAHAKLQTSSSLANASPFANKSGLIPIAALLLIGFAIGYAISNINHGPSYVSVPAEPGEKSLVTNDWHGNVQRSNHY